MVKDILHLLLIFHGRTKLPGSLLNLSAVKTIQLSEKKYALYMEKVHANLKFPLICQLDYITLLVIQTGLKILAKHLFSEKI